MSRLTPAPSTTAFGASAAPSCHPRHRGEKVPGLNLGLTYSPSGWRKGTSLNHYATKQRPQVARGTPPAHCIGRNVFVGAWPSCPQDGCGRREAGCAGGLAALFRRRSLRARGVRSTQCRGDHRHVLPVRTGAPRQVPTCANHTKVSIHAIVQ
jgi:hypothetical protein